MENVVTGEGRWGAYKTIFRLGLPVLVTQIGNIVYGMADTMMVGAYGTRELAAAAFVNNIFLIPLVMLMGFAGGITPLVGALYGAGKNYDAGSLLRVGIRMNLQVAMVLVAFMVGLYFFLPHMGQDADILPLIQQYYLIVLASLVMGALFYPCMQMALGVTDTVRPMVIITFANIFNIVGNYALIYGNWGFPEWGLNGAGLSTAIGRLISTIAMVGVVMWGRRYKAYKDGFKWRNGKVAGQRQTLWTTSLPVSVQSGVECSLWGIGAVVCGWFGKEQLAGYQVVVSISQLGFMTYMSFATAVAIKVANFTGTGDRLGIRRHTIAGLHMILVLATLASLAFWLFGAPIMDLFTEDRSVIAVGLTLIVPLVLYQYADAVQILYVNALKGTGHTLPLMWISIIAYIVVGLPVLLLFAKVFAWHAAGVFYSFSVALLVAAVLYRRSFIRTQRT